MTRQKHNPHTSTYIALAGANSAPSPEGWSNEFEATSVDEAREMLSERLASFGLNATGVATCSFVVRERH